MSAEFRVRSAEEASLSPHSALHIRHSVLPHCVRQLDGYPLLRECRRGWEQGYDVYDAVRQGEVLVSEERACRLGDFLPREGKTAQKARDQVVAWLEKGIDWRVATGDLDSPNPSLTWPVRYSSLAKRLPRRRKHASAKSDYTASKGGACLVPHRWGGFQADARFAAVGTRSIALIEQTQGS